MSDQGNISHLKVHHENSLPPLEIIDLFKTTFSPELYESDDLERLQGEIQSVKADLYNRAYIAAFSDDAKRVAYCCRWSPSRATAYASLFANFPEISDILQCKEGDGSVLCIGGGAGGELVALASVFAPSRDFRSKFTSSKIQSSASAAQKNTLNVHLVDISDWSTVVDRLAETIRKRWLYADESKYFNVNFIKDDILKIDYNRLALSRLDFISLLFTTNELFSENRAESIRLLQNFNLHCKPGCYLLITESAGSYSHITVGTKKFPIQFLVDTVLVGKRGQESTGSWKLIHQSDSTWYRGDLKLDYPLKLENMRFFYRLYKKT